MGHTISRTEQLDPRTLLVDVNVRTDAQLDKQFVGTIRDHGVLVPIVALDTPDGVRVRFGHRRTLAAVEAGLDTVPVVVIDPQTGDAESDAAEIDRIVTQHVENTHRAGLTTAEDVAVAGQPAAFGLSVNQIARRTRTKRAHVALAVAAAESELAAKATERYDLTLEQAATLAEFFVMWTQLDQLGDQARHGGLCHAGTRDDVAARDGAGVPYEAEHEPQIVPTHVSRSGGVSDGQPRHAPSLPDAAAPGIRYVTDAPPPDLRGACVTYR